MGLIPDNLLDCLPADLWPKTITLQAEADDSDDYADVAGLTDLSARKMTVGKGNKDESQVWAENIGATIVFQLKGFYPDVSDVMRVQCEGRYYPICKEGVRHPNETLTVLACNTTKATT